MGEREKKSTRERDDERERQRRREREWTCVSEGEKGLERERKRVCVRVREREGDSKSLGPQSGDFYSISASRSWSFHLSLIIHWEIAASFGDSLENCVQETAVIALSLFPSLSRWHIHTLTVCLILSLFPSLMPCLCLSHSRSLFLPFPCCSVSFSPCLASVFVRPEEGVWLRHNAQQNTLWQSGRRCVAKHFTVNNNKPGDKCDTVTGWVYCVSYNSVRPLVRYKQRPSDSYEMYHAAQDGSWKNKATETL